MSYQAKLLADSISEQGIRLTSFEATFPRPVLAEFNTHRVFSRNSASSRAIPVAKQIRKVLDDPFIPEQFGKNQPGMQSDEFLEGTAHHEAVAAWLRGRDRAVASALELLLGRSKLPGNLSSFSAQDIQELLEQFNHQVQAGQAASYLNVHKQLANRVLEPYMWHTVIVTATEWSNFFALRTHRDAQPEIRTIALMLEKAAAESQPQPLSAGQWHLPLVREQDRAELDLPDLIKVSVGRCARVSYETHAGLRDPQDDIRLYEKLIASGHMSPAEHAATPWTTHRQVLCRAMQMKVQKAPDLGDKERRRMVDSLEFDGNFRGWQQHRKDLVFESDYAQVLARSSS